MDINNNTDDGYDADFVDEVADYLKCIICHFVLRDPVLYIECGHRFCSGCFERMKKYAIERDMDILCPHDRIKIDINQVFPDKGVSRVALDLKVKCSNHGDGCNWIGELRDLQSHLDNVCGYQEKKNTSQLLVQLMKRIESCEKRLAEKDIQIVFLQEESKCYKENLDEKEKQIELLQIDSKLHRESLLEKETQIRMLQKVRKSCTKHGKSKDDDNFYLHETMISKEFVESHVKGLNSDSNNSASQVKLNEDIKERFVALEKHVMNVQEYNQNDNYVVFEWKMENYRFHRDLDKTMFSPMFYSEINGPCFKLYLKWYGDEKSRLGVYLVACKDIWNATSPPPPHLSFKIETWDKYGELKSFCSKSYDKASYSIEFGKKESKGRGTPEFLSLPSLANFIIGDTLTLRCTLFLKT